MHCQHEEDGKKIIFSGRYYEAWRNSIVSGLVGQSYALDLIQESPTERDFLRTPPHLHTQQQIAYYVRQEAAKSYIYNRLTLSIQNTVRRCRTVSQILAKLDAEYRRTSAAAENVARRRFFSLRIEKSEEIHQYLAKFSDCADLLRDTGYILEVEEEIKQLMSSMNRDYSVAITEYRLHAAQYGHSLQLLRRLLIDAFDTDLDDKQILSKYSNVKSDDKSSDRPNGNANRKFGNRNKPGFSAENEKKQSTSEMKQETESATEKTEFTKSVKCHRCSGVGHFSSECATKLKTTKEDTKQPTSFDDKPRAMMIRLPDTQVRKTKNFFLLDSGAHCHLTAKLHLLSNVISLREPKEFTCAVQNIPLVATHRGELMIDVHNRFGEKRVVHLREVFYIPNLEVDVIAEEQITKTERFEVRFSHQYADVYDLELKEITFSAVRENGSKIVYYEPTNTGSKVQERACPVRRNENASTSSAPSSTASDSVDGPREPEMRNEASVSEHEKLKWLWHRRLGHISGKYLRLLLPNVEGIPSKLTVRDDDFRDCEICVMAKSSELGHTAIRRKATRKCDIISTDVMGPFTPAKTAFARYHKTLESSFPNEPVSILRADCAKEYIDGDMKRYCAAAGAMRAAAYLVNRSPSRTNPDFKSPFELWYGRRPDVKNLRIFGAVAYRHIPDEVRRQTATSLRRKDIPLTPEAADTNDAETQTEIEISEQRDIPAPPTTLPTDIAEEIMVETYQPKWDHSYAMAVQRKTKPLLEESVPASYAELKGNPHESAWREAVRVELQAMKDNEVFVIVKRHTNAKVIDTKWLFTVKYSSSGEPMAKARLVARGFSDRHQYSVSETYSPVVNNWLIRWAFSLANRRNLQMRQFDVSTAFLNADVSQPTYIAMPDGLVSSSSDRMLQLRKSLYGLKPSSKNWYDLLNETILSMKFVKSKADRCLYYRHLPEGGIAIMLVYVDDILLLTDRADILQQTTETLAKHFRIKVTENPTFFVGYEIHRKNSKIMLSQTRYIDRLLDRFAMSDAYPQKTPMETSLRITKPENGVDDREFRAMIGALLFLARNTRPDIAYAVNTLSRIQNCSTDVEKNYLRRIFRYLKGTRDLKLTFHSNGSKLEAYVDASYAPNVCEPNPHLTLENGRSTTGYLLCLFGDPIVWGVKRQTITASSSTAAELIAVHDSLDEIRMAHAVMKEIFGITDPVTVFEDNSSTATILMGGEQKKVRSILIKCYDTLEAVANKEIVIKNVPSASQLADLLTKPLDRETFERLTSKIFQNV